MKRFIHLRVISFVFLVTGFAESGGLSGDREDSSNCQTTRRLERLAHERLLGLVPDPRPPLSAIVLDQAHVVTNTLLEEGLEALPSDFPSDNFRSFLICVSYVLQNRKPGERCEIKIPSLRVLEDQTLLRENPKIGYVHVGGTPTFMGFVDRTSVTLLRPSDERQFVTILLSIPSLMQAYEVLVQRFVSCRNGSLIPE